MTTLSRSTLYRMIRTVGVHRDVLIRVRRVQVLDATVRSEIELKYQTASPVCCPEAACYHRFLQPNGLH
ncbi:MAG: hypothetical protein AAF645_29245, partial [Myxococcota bacterium]